MLSDLLEKEEYILKVMRLVPHLSIVMLKGMTRKLGFRSAPKCLVWKVLKEFK